MHARTIQQDILEKEGLHNYATPTRFDGDTPYSMSWFYSFLDPTRDRSHRPTVDVSAPMNPMDEAHRARKYGVQKMGVGFRSMNAWTGVKEEVPYADSQHTYEVAKWTTIGSICTWFNLYIARNMTGNVTIGHPRMFAAWNVAFFAGLTRITAASILGAYGYFYSYEWMYTYAPFLKINDPTPNGWKRGWDEGQSTFGARALACVFPALANWFYVGSKKRAHIYLCTALFFSLQWEYARIYVMPGNRLFYNFLAEKDLNRQSNFGSLAGTLKRRADPDTGKMEGVHQYKYVQSMNGTFQNIMWDNLTPDTMPLHKAGRKIPNPYFNWQKAAQGYHSSKLERKNDMWKLPPVMDARMMSGAMDRR